MIPSTYPSIQFHRVTAISVKRSRFPSGDVHKRHLSIVIDSHDAFGEPTSFAVDVYHDDSDLPIDDPDAPIAQVDPDDASPFVGPREPDEIDESEILEDDRDPSVCPRCEGTGNGLGTYSRNPEFNTLDGCEECEGTGKAPVPCPHCGKPSLPDAAGDYRHVDFAPDCIWQPTTADALDGPHDDMGTYVDGDDRPEIDRPDGDYLQQSIDNINRWGDTLAKQRANRSGLFPTRWADETRAETYDDMRTWAEFGGEGR